MTLSAAALLGLFASAFLAATLLPAQSEAVLVGLLLAHPASVAVLVATASLGNTLGAMVNWLLGLGIQRFRNKRWFPVSARQLERAERHYRRFGRWSLLLSWMPIVGDPLVFGCWCSARKVLDCLSAYCACKNRAIPGACGIYLGMARRIGLTSLRQLTRANYGAAQWLADTELEKF